MSLRRERVIENYSRGLNDFIGNEVEITDEMRDIINGVDFSDLPITADLSDAYYSITRDLIEGMSTDDCKLSTNMRNGLAEAVAQRIWKRNLPGIENGRSFFNPNWVPYQISDILVDAIGSEVGSACTLKAPDLMGDLLHSIPYKDTSLMGYLNVHVDKAVTQFRSITSNNLGHSSEVINCCEAICDCRDKLQLPKEIARRNKDKGKSKSFER